MVPHVMSSAGIWLHRPMPLHALQVPQTVPADGYWQCAWPSHMPPHLCVGSLALSTQVALSVPAGSGMQVPVLSQVPQWLHSVLQQTPIVPPSGNRAGAAEALRVARAGVAERELRRAARHVSAVDAAVGRHDLAVAPDLAVGIGPAVRLALWPRRGVREAAEPVAVFVVVGAGSCPRRRTRRRRA
jgi:hypothetical protein